MEGSHYDEIADDVLNKGLTVQSAKTRACRRHRLKKYPSNAEILGNVGAEKRKLLKPILMKKPIRSLSGVAVVAVMTSPAACPHGRCLYCPTGENSPQSYTGFEPAALRGKRAGFDPFKQVTDRLGQLRATGHNIDKAELIVMGGTFPAREEEYKSWFIRRCLDAMNSFGAPEPREAEAVSTAQEENETAGVRCVGMTFETRPDYAREAQVDEMLALGTTRVELGVQTLGDDILKRVKRGHTVEDVIDSTRVIKDRGLKVGYHMMPGLFSDSKGDLEMFQTLFSSADFRPDMLKIYPTLVLEGTGLHELWQDGEFTPPDLDETVNLLVEVKKLLPKWVRTMRIQRDIPAQLIAAGIRKGNLGELVERRLEEEGARCRCIRCREAGHIAYKKGVSPGPLEVMEEGYAASNGRELFISMEDPEKDIITGYLRLRFPSEGPHRHETDSKTSLIRELKVLGHALRIGEPASETGQHRGIGKVLIERAEEISREGGIEKVLVTSGVGAREYYRKIGYRRLGPYMSKEL